MVEIAGLATDLEQSIDRPRSRQRLPRGCDVAVVKLRLGCGLETPVVEPQIPDFVRSVAKGIFSQIDLFTTAGLQQENAGSGIGRQPVGENASAEASTATDIIELAAVLTCAGHE